MALSESERKELDAFPAVLRSLLEAELAAGNEIAEIGHSFPAPPVGAYVQLVRPITTLPRAAGEGLKFRERNSSIYSGEFTDAKGFFFVLEPPLPPPPEPDMDAIRSAAMSESSSPVPPAIVNREAGARPESPPEPPHAPQLASPLERFRGSMAIDYEKWREGTGYDLDALRAATPTERQAIEKLVIQHEPRGWRDVEALAALDTPAARSELKASMSDDNAEVRMAVSRHAPQLIPERARLSSLVKALETAVFYGGLSQALAEAEELHPPEVMDVLFRGALHREGGVAVHFAAMLTFLHGRASARFDMKQRPFFLRFNTADRREREAVFRELCEKLGVDPEPHLQAS